MLILPITTWLCNLEQVWHASLDINFSVCETRGLDQMIPNVLQSMTICDGNRGDFKIKGGCVFTSVIFIYFLIFLRESMSRGGAERKGERESQACLGAQRWDQSHDREITT